VTFDTAANPSHLRASGNPALTAALAVAVIAAATLAGAWFFELVRDIRPCPLCLEQRYAYYLAVPLGFLVAFAASRGAPRSLLLLGLAILPLAALANAWLGGYHAGVEWVLAGADRLHRAGGQSGAPARCATARQRESDPLRRGAVALLGLSLAGYNVLISFDGRHRGVGFFAAKRS
jgi:disulfide bond formation protein DsbB